MNLLIFDIDGTLTATNEVDTRCFTRAFLEVFDIALDPSWHLYPHRTDSGIICHSFSQHFVRAPTAAELELFRERFLILLESEWRADPRNFAAIAGATEVFTGVAQQRDYALALATGGWRASALFKLEKGGIPAVGLPAAFADDAIEREGIARIVSIARDFITGNRSIGSSSWGIPTAMSIRRRDLGWGSWESRLMPTMGRSGRQVRNSCCATTRISPHS